MRQSPQYCREERILLGCCGGILGLLKIILDEYFANIALRFTKTVCNNMSIKAKKHV